MLGQNSSTRPEFLLAWNRPASIAQMERDLMASQWSLGERSAIGLGCNMLRYICFIVHCQCI